MCGAGSRPTARPVVDHVVRAGVRYLERHGDQYALVPLFMVAFAVAGYLLLGDPELMAELQESVTATVGPGLAASPAARHRMGGHAGVPVSLGG